MKERPILFSAPMVRAILDGRKTQTRRVVSITPPLSLPNYYSTGRVLCNLENQPGAFMEFRHISQDEAGFTGSQAAFLLRCPYGQPGDRLWVRESFMPAPLETPHEEPREVRWNIAYGAGGQMECMAPAKYNPMLYNYERWKPSIHMPRWASRILLEIVSVRTERLQDISEADAKAEGSSELLRKGFTHKHGFELIWESINGVGSWQTNPWVWVIEFKVVNQ